MREEKKGMEIQEVELKNGTIYLDGKEVKNLMDYKITGRIEQGEIVDIELNIFARIKESN